MAYELSSFEAREMIPVELRNAFDDFAVRFAGAKIYFRTGEVIRKDAQMIADWLLGGMSKNEVLLRYRSLRGVSENTARSRLATANEIIKRKKES